MSKNNPYNFRKSDLKKINYFDQTDTPDGVYRRKVEDFNENKLYEWELPEQENNSELPKNRWDLGRNCPFCAGRLVTYGMIEERDEEFHLLRCTSCKRTVFEDDISHRDETTDKIYRSVSDRMFQKWADFQDKR